jgi:hypothetical protein
MKGDLSNYQPVCSPLITLNCLVEFHEIWYGSNAIQGDFEAIIFNSISSIILKVLRFKVVRGALLNCGFGLFTFHGNHGKFTAVNSVTLSQTELNEVKVSSFKLTSIKLGSSTSYK